MSNSRMINAMAAAENAQTHKHATITMWTNRLLHIPQYLLCKQ